MKRYTAMIALAAFAFATPALAKSMEEEKQDVRDSKAAVAKDDAAIAKQQDNIDVNRAEKADAKERGDVANQASQSVQIGANKAAIAEKKVERKVDQKILEKDQKDVREAAPAAGSNTKSNY